MESGRNVERKMKSMSTEEAKNLKDGGVINREIAKVYTPGTLGLSASVDSEYDSSFIAVFEE